MTKTLVFCLLFTIPGFAIAQSGPPSGLYGFKFGTSKTEVERQVTDQKYSFLESGNGYLIDQQNGQRLENFYRIVPLKFVSLDFSASNLLNAITLSFVVVPSELVTVRYVARNKTFDYLRAQIDSVYEKAGPPPTYDDFDNSIREWNVANTVRITLFWYGDIFSLNYSLIDASSSKDDL